MELEIISALAKNGGGSFGGILVFFVIQYWYNKFQTRNGNGKTKIVQDAQYDDHIKLLIVGAIKEYNNEIREEMRRDKDEIVKQMTENKTSLADAVQAVHRRIDKVLDKS